METITGTDIQEARRWLREGKWVAVPTETVYGLAANALDPDAVAGIFEVKERPHFNPLIVHIAYWEQLEELCPEVPEAAMQLAETFWPGPLTLVLPRSEKVPQIVTGGLETVAIRMPAHPMMMHLILSCGFPLAAPSANLFGRTSPTTAAHVEKQLKGRIPYILDGGPSEIGIESTIVGFENGNPVIFREGGIPSEDIREVLPDIALRSAATDKPNAPGMIKEHYAPGKPLYFGTADELTKHIEARAYALISLNDHPLSQEASLHIMLSPENDLRHAASGFFEAIHEADDSHAEIILIERFPDEGLGRAMNDRAIRAAAGSQA